MDDTVIDVRHLTKRFGGRAVVDDVSMRVNRGEIVGFLGPNGSGKTTTIRMICGLLTIDEGEGEVLGHDLRTESRAIKDQVGYMTQRFSLYEDLTIEENLDLVEGEQAAHHADRRGLARAVWPEEADDLAAVDRHRHVVDHGAAAEALGQVAHVDHRLGRVVRRGRG